MPMKAITVAQLRQNPTAALDDVQAGQSYVITRHRHAIARLVPVDTSALGVIPARSPGGSRLSQRPQRRTYDEAETTLADIRAER